MNGNSYRKTEVEREFLGTGIAFPFQLNPTNQLKLASGEEDIRQSVRIILGTAPGERLMRPEFGCRAHELLFAPYDVAAEALLIHYVEEALAQWEPRIEVKTVTIDSSRQDGVMAVNIQYTIKATHDERSIVYPFYLAEEL